MNVSVVVLTLNEEANIGGCLDSLAWADDIVILDSQSSDATVQIGTERGARVVRRVFDTYAGQRNFALREICYRHEWLLMVDADERIPEDLKAEILDATAAAPADATLYLMRRRDHLFGRWIKRSSGYPTWFGRLARIGHVWVERPINEEYCTNGRTARLQCHIDHFPFNKGFSEWISKHDRYSTQEAILKLERRGERTSMAAIFSRDPVERRKALKSTLYRLPARPLVVFLALYLLKGGVLEGRAGFTFSLLRSWYEFMIDCKYRELVRRRRGLPI